MWTILESARVPQDVAKCPPQVKEKYEFWKNVVRNSGPPGLREIRGFHDEALAEPWTGYRSSRLNRQYRVIYRVDGTTVHIFVDRVTPHDYRR
jgi:mRNA-degrading endonuclease YafQ of YafQ-DinJ toxin-antitoxin module